MAPAACLVGVWCWGFAALVSDAIPVSGVMVIYLVFCGMSGEVDLRRLV